MSKKEFKVVFSDGSENGDFPVAVKHTQVFGLGDGSTEENIVVDPILSGQIYSNLYGRVMTLVEATTDAYKLKAVKDLFAKELQSWSSDVFDSARKLAGDKVQRDIDNLYTKGRLTK